MVNIPPLPEIDEPEAVEALGNTIKDAGDKVQAKAEDVKSTWAPISSAYHAPEEGIVHRAMNRPAESAQQIQENAADKCTALHEYAGKLTNFRLEKSRLEGEIAAAEAALALAEALPDEVSEPDPDNPGETRMVHNDEKDAAIAAAEAELERLAGEVQKLINDLETADSELAEKFWDSTNDHLLGDLFFNLFFNPTLLIGILEGVYTWGADLVVTAKDLWGLGQTGARYAWNNRGKIFDAVKGLPEFVKSGGLGRTKEALETAYHKFFTEENTKQLWSQFKTWSRRQASNIAHDPAHAIGYLAPDIALGVVTGGSATAAGVGARTTAGTAVRTGAKQFGKETAESITGAAGRELVEEGAERGAGAVGAVGRNQVADSPHEVARTLKPQPGAGSQIADVAQHTEPNVDRIVSNQADIPKGQTSTANTWVGDGVESTTGPVPEPLNPEGTPELTLREQMDQAWSEAEKPTQRLMPDIEYTNSRRRADLAASYEDLGDPSRAAAVRYLYNADTVRNLHSAVLEDPTVLERIKPGSGELSFSVNNSIAPPPEVHYSDVTEHLVTDGPIEPLLSPVPPSEWSTSVAADSDLIPEATVIDEIGTRTRHGYLKWDHGAEAHIQRSFRNEDGKVLGEADARGLTDRAFSSDDPIRKDGHDGRSFVKKNGQISHTPEEVEAYTKEHGTPPPHDDAGHLLPGNLFPNIGAANFTGQDSSLNRGSNKQFEDVPRDILNHPEDSYVDYRMHAPLEESGRPELYSGEVIGWHKASGQEILRLKQEFVNAPGRQFSRNPNVLNALDQPDVRKRAIDALFDAIVNGRES